ncbi:TetR/AcrR family transcriptional regulator [Loigolactobacillus jiayinensis]|uniref:TetR/AcrR family transcriptional regulator n=1 Tax=Loigolactobacillus jiayinensis TaxID=2486016 RepID=A0ABW1RHC5_9LACO|nr:TetR/AcrR family transcriptional regulator [Loigolactobacillus jiayinensis]
MKKDSSKGEQQKNKILTVARKLFATKGFEATTTREINRQTDSAEGLLYYYFPHGKREILDTIIYEGIQSRINGVDFKFHEADSLANIEAQLLHAFNQIWQIFSKQDNYYSFMITIRERMLLSDEQVKWLLDLINKVKQLLVDFLMTATKKLQLDQTAIPQLVGIIMSLFQSIIYRELLINNNQKLTEQISTSISEQLHLLVTSVLAVNGGYKM